MTLAKPTFCFLMTATCLLILGSQTTFAGTMGDIGARPPLYQPLATFTIGPDFVQKGHAQTLSLLPPFQNHYTNTRHSATVADAGAFIGFERTLNDKLSAQLGISGYVDAQVSPEGHVWRFASPEFDMFRYAYNVHHTRVMTEGKFLTIFGQHQALHPYVSWGLGVAFNQANHYQESPLLPGAIPTLPFASHTKTSFTWDVGAGMDYNINPHVRIGVGYQFADLGGVSLGSTYAATTRQTLNFSHLFTNQLRFQLTFLV